jgi:hypothetical protein
MNTHRSSNNPYLGFLQAQMDMQDLFEGDEVIAI